MAQDRNRQAAGGDSAHDPAAPTEYRPMRRAGAYFPPAPATAHAPTATPDCAQTHVIDDWAARKKDWVKSMPKRPAHWRTAGRTCLRQVLPLQRRTGPYSPSTRRAASRRPTVGVPVKLLGLPIRPHKASKITDSHLLSIVNNRHSSCDNAQILVISQSKCLNPLNRNGYFHLVLSTHSKLRRPLTR